MKKKDLMAQLQEMSVEELTDQADSLKESLFRLKFKRSLGVGDALSDIRREKRTLARVFTIIKQKETEAKKAQA
jgi:ribosomal protein L29